MVLLTWNKEQKDFQDYWLWQFGKGPFQLVKKYSVPTQPSYMGYPYEKPIEILFEPGEWYVILLSKDAEMRIDCGVNHVMFHEKWLSALEDVVSKSE